MQLLRNLSHHMAVLVTSYSNQILHRFPITYIVQQTANNRNIANIQKGYTCCCYRQILSIQKGYTVKTYLFF